MTSETVRGNLNFSYRHYQEEDIKRYWYEWKNCILHTISCTSGKEKCILYTIFLNYLLLKIDP